MSTNSMQEVMPSVDWEEARECRSAMDCTMPMGVTSDTVATRFGVSRADQDALAARSHTLAAAARARGDFVAEIVGVPVKGEGGAPHVVATDDGIRADTTVEKLGKLAPAFTDDGSTTAGNSSQVSDGAAAAVLTRRSVAVARGLPILATLRSWAVVGVPPDIMGIGPAVAIPAALAKAGLRTTDIDAYELNEAFASQALYCMRALGLDKEPMRARVNPLGGAIALGHPLGCTGARQVATLLHHLARTGGRYGVVSMCIGTGMGMAAVFEREPAFSLAAGAGAGGSGAVRARL